MKDLEKPLTLAGALNIIWLAFLFDAQWVGLFWWTLFVILMVVAEANDKLESQQPK